MDIISSPENRLIKEYRKVASSAKYRKTSGLFVAEGARLVIDAVKNGVFPENIFMLEKVYESLKQTLPQDLKVTLISEQVSKKLTDTKNTQGLFAVFKKPMPCSVENMLKGSSKILVLENLQDPGNMGTILRTLDALGTDGIISCSSVEMFNPKTVRAAMGALLRVKYFECSNILEIFPILKQHGVETFASCLHRESVFLSENTFEKCKKAAVFIGNEGSGLSEKTINLCDKKIMIPMTENAESLNAAMAAGIFMWEMTKHKTFLNEADKK